MRGAPLRRVDGCDGAAGVLEHVLGAELIDQAEAFVRRGLSLLGVDRVCIIQQTRFLNSRGRYKLFTEFPPTDVLILSRRPSMPPGHLLAEMTANGTAFNDASVLLDAAAAGLGVALTRYSLAHPRLLDGQLVLAAPQQCASPSAHYLVCRKECLALPAVAAFVAWLRLEAKTWVNRP